MVYLGGKFYQSDAYVKILKKVAKETGATVYVEPFVGGFNIPTRLAMKGSPFLEHRLSDMMRDTIRLHEAVAFEGYWPTPVDEATYRRLRDERPDTLEAHAAGLLQAYSGKRWDSFVPFESEAGKWRDGVVPYFVSKVNSLFRDARALRDLQGITLNVCPYDEVVIPDGAIVYCDPPYANTTAYNTGEQFDHIAFWLWANELAKRCTVLVSEFTVPYDWVVVYEKGKQNSVAANKKAARRIEYLVQKGPERPDTTPTINPKGSAVVVDHSWLDWLEG